VKEKTYQLCEDPTPFTVGEFWHWAFSETSEYSDSVIRERILVGVCGRKSVEIGAGWQTDDLAMSVNGVQVRLKKAPAAELDKVAFIKLYDGDIPDAAAEYLGEKSSLADVYVFRVFKTQKRGGNVFLDLEPDEYYALSRQRRRTSNAGVNP